MNNTNEAITDSRNNESLRLNDNDSVEIDNGEFKTIVRKRRRNLHLIKGKFSDKKSSKVKDLLEKK